jgi:PadR family transcriptional regulator, regulatory protein PadR
VIGISNFFTTVLSHTYYRSDEIKEAFDIENLTEMLKGSLEGCVLEIISRHETYGYEITRRLNDLGFTEVVEGTVYTILVRLEKKKLVDIVKKPSDMGPPRKFYTLNEAGRQELESFWRKWDFVSSKINVLKSQ